jgi:hypothetical protein
MSHLSIVALVLLLPASARPVSDARVLGFNVNNLQSGNFSSDLAYATSTADSLHAGVLRYPGGNLADFWDWRSGWCVAAKTAQGCPSCSNPCANKPTKRLYPLAEFALAVKRASARSVLLLNMLTDTLESQLEFLAEAERLGVLDASSYVELGGEFYWGKFSGRWPMASDYATEANQWAMAIKKRFPTVSVVAIAAHIMPQVHEGGGREPPAVDDRASQWNAQLYALVSTDVDGVVMHPYLHLDSDFVGGGPLQPGVPPRVKGEGPTGWCANASVQQLFVDEVLKNDAAMGLLLGVPFFVASEAAGNAATRTKLPERLRMIVTEYNGACLMTDYTLIIYADYACG